MLALKNNIQNNNTRVFLGALLQQSKLFIIFFIFSADEKFDGTYQTNVVVSSEGGCLYVPPGIFKVETCLRMEISKLS